ncbi:hypothetical protein BKA67DRAFT_514151 [Truncatella angustata]|uniref:FabD/lysophospholipase-like protein n=1 Tax=Truncatella angustata TaxID=152316 RepID=A0A9P8UQ16_9PEZI|nr:uncharacterized protein BKA67DRAFT_514151 [Truncatella angustata]KAH6656249.1 hypothetical protein BKA67DRAFT_514151 [Truncatella angustata]
MAAIAPSVTQPCQTCGTTKDKIYSCVQCNNLSFCDGCWSKWILHLPGQVGWDGRAHERSDPLVVLRMRQILEPVRSETEHEAELRDDEDTSWFGFGRDGTGHPVFHDYGRFAAIMADSVREDVPERHPQLASFIGETGAGKSTIIKLLIDRQDLSSTEAPRYYSPVTSSNHDRIPTTGDVHLYADPSSIHASQPLLLCDCEGLSGGEMLPKQLRNRADDLANGYKTSQSRKIAWAKTPNTRKREFAVAQLYPRILYTFSDVVVFVLRNPRAFESTVLPKLLKWGAASIDKSLNQPVLPHAVIVLNATEPGVDEKEWDVDTATQMLMSDIAGAVHREPVIQDYVTQWRKRGKHIGSTKELLECYYASVSVVRIPYKGSYMLMNDQSGKLADLIRDRAQLSHLRKRKVRMLATPEKLQFYLHAAFDHFTTDLDTPFDFIKETLRHSPVSRNFEGNILNLALAIRDRAANSKVKNNAKQIFRAMVPIIASCVMFDTVRQNLLGTASRLLDDRYAKPCTAAMQTFADMHWPCSFKNSAYPGKSGQCCNMRSGHNPKGHQNIQGKIIGNGDYESDLDPSEFAPTWNHFIRQSLIQLQSSAFRLSQEFPDMPEIQVAALLHRERLNEQYSNILGAATDFISYSACLCCLRELPECALPCGHVLCLPCVQIYGTRTSKTTIEISRCPLHIRDVIASPPWILNIKPDHAGTRTLCLDGGGIRGVVQLTILREMEKILGPELPLQLFFDLIIGSSMGGIIAIGLGVKKWSAQATMEKFKDLCKEAFIPREMKNVPVFGMISSLYHGSLYKTQPFEKALKRYFSEQPFFGVSTNRSRHNVSLKVAVTASTLIEHQAVVFANYNRPDPIRIWEAARATSATQPFFKPFRKEETDYEYVDGGVHQTCPIWVSHHEAKAIWNDKHRPDLVLSIGTGQNVGDKRATSSTMRGNTNTPSSDSIRTSNAGYFYRDPRTPMLFSFNNPGAGAERSDDHREGEEIWNKYMSRGFVAESDRSRYMRMNPELFSELPKFADVTKMDDLEQHTEDAIRRNPGIVLEVVHRLVASTFFFEKDAGPVKQTSEGYTCTGAIYCRFRLGSSELKALGWLLVSTSCLEGDFEPYFLLEEDKTRLPARQIVLTQTILQDMHFHGHFELEPLTITTLDETSEISLSLILHQTPYPSGSTVLPISGFPRRIMSEPAGNVPAGFGEMKSGMFPINPSSCNKFHSTAHPHIHAAASMYTHAVIVKSRSLPNPHSHKAKNGIFNQFLFTKIAHPCSSHSGRRTGVL